MTELPGKEPDIPARISVGISTTGKSMINNKQKTGNFNLRDNTTEQNILTLIVHCGKQTAEGNHYRRLSSLNKEKGF